MRVFRMMPKSFPFKGKPEEDGGGDEGREVLITALVITSLAFLLEIQVGRVTTVFHAGAVGFLRGGISTGQN